MPLSPVGGAPASGGDAPEVLVRMTGIQKRFPGVHALDGASFELRRGEVHALVGENGAGKSSMMKVLAGVYEPDAGTLELRGRPVRMNGPASALGHGISMIHQELNLVPHLSVAQNVFMGREPRRARAFLDDRALNTAAAQLFARLHLDLDPRERTADLTVAKQQMVEIAKALSVQADVLIMDEPTATLTDTEIAELFRIIRGLRERGVGVVHISHRLEELRQISDRITVMRDGRTIRTLATAQARLPEVISLMVGREVYDATPELPDAPPSEVLLEVRGLAAGRMVKDVSFTLHRGEILGVAGLVGAGRTEMARAVFGADRATAGRITIKGREAVPASPSDAVRRGLAYLSEDRKRYGVAVDMDVESNVVMASMRRFTRLGWIDARATRRAAGEQVRTLGIKTPRLGQRVRHLSGGNQQKVVLAKWLTADCDVLIVDEPTRGIDVGARSEIYGLLNRLAQQGKGIVMISSDLPEILRMSHRVLVMCEGRVTGELTAAEATQERIMTLATQRDDAIDPARAEPQESAT
jgi:ribose transport system ATP-binding protein